MDSFIVNALVAGVGLAIVTGPLGCFLVWRRMAYFGDTIAHSGLLGIALGFLLGINLVVGVLAIGIVIAVILALLQRQHRLATDTLLGILAHTTLSLGLVVIGLMPWLRVDLVGYLFGDILAINRTDLIWIWGGGIVILAVLAALWRPLLAITVHEDLARAEGVRAMLARMGFMVLIALVIAIAMKIVGILLITALSIIPAAAARRFSRSPEGMALLAAVNGILAVMMGISGSLAFDTPTGPSIVVAATAIFLFGQLPFFKVVR